MSAELNNAGTIASGKGHRDENFPVASALISPRHRAIVLAFYRFARVADDVADHASLKPEEKLSLLDRMEETLLGRNDAEPDALPLRTALAERKMSPRHPLDLLKAFRLDVTKLRDRDWDDLMDYCRYSANPVGRFVLDVHGEDERTWPANDALCSALQVINHLQDCAKDYRELNRVYIPEPMLQAAGIGVEALAQDKANPALARVISALARKNADLLNTSRPFARAIQDGRLALEVDLIQTIADDLTRLLMNRDPLSEPVHHSKMDVAALFLKRFPSFALMRLMRPKKPV